MNTSNASKARGERPELQSVKVAVDGAPELAARDGAAQLSQEGASKLMRSLYGARAMLRCLLLAEVSFTEGTTEYKDCEGTGRWSGVMGEVCLLLDEVREIEVNTMGIHYIDWHVFLRLAEAIDSALWHGLGGGADPLGHDDLIHALRQLAIMIDNAIQGCIAGGVERRAACHGFHVVAVPRMTTPSGEPVIRSTDSRPGASQAAIRACRQPDRSSRRVFLLSSAREDDK